MATLRLFAAAREAAGTGSVQLQGNTVGDVIGMAVGKFGPSFEAVLPSCRIWVNGDPADADMQVSDADEVAVLPPVSGGC